MRNKCDWLRPHSWTLTSFGIAKILLVSTNRSTDRFSTSHLTLIFHVVSVGRRTVAVMLDISIVSPCVMDSFTFNLHYAQMFVDGSLSLVHCQSPSN
ncbi:hypothetical protein Y032_0141g2268 [Ancylostoma ceylanicum]|uniref:Uncharacterized protein n=1 Tax=Ancylostoma ceylanicum TaxID=53326 RepID=A0A016T428_9BILA|nr:hypothetical protein Y032_0141g2268 [Ancylostoma ceylanicum]